MDTAFGASGLALLAALFWGSASFFGGIASRHLSALAVVAFSHTVGLLVVLSLAIGVGERQPPAQDFVWGAAAGLAGAVGIAALYHALSLGKAGVAAPISAILAAALPVTWSITVRGLPSLVGIAGLALGLLGIYLVSRPGERAEGRKGIGFAVLSGLGFGVFFILTSGFSGESVFLPLVAARAASALVASTLVILMGVKIRLRRRWVWWVIAAAGAIDIAGTAFYAASAQFGRLDISAVASSLYPAVTILWAYIVLRERITGMQSIGIVTGLVAIGLISIG
jgi:drug/metabolite transporter (DMT)-like permease